MAASDINRKTTGITLTPEESSEIWAEIQEESAIMRLARKVSLPGNGISIQVITGDPQAAWVNETEAKPVSNSTFALKTMVPYKLAVIETLSCEFERDKAALAAELIRRLPGALAKKFDATVFGAGTAPGSNFDTLKTAPAVDLKAKPYDALVEADTLVATAGGELSGWVISPQARGILLGAKDTQGRPLFINNASEGAVPAILGAPTYQTKAAYIAGTPNLVGIAGDWKDAIYGTVEGVVIKKATEATVGGINLFEKNMVAYLAEIEVGFVVKSITEFVRLTTPAAA